MKAFYFDVETTGTDPRKHGLIQLAAIIFVDGKEVATFAEKIKPFASDEITEEAIAIHGITPKEMESFTDPGAAYHNLTALLDKYVDKYDRKDKFFAVGFNSRFDMDFLRAFFQKNGDKYFGSYFYWPDIDVARITAYWMVDKRPEMENFKLTTVARYLGIDVDEDKAHDALYDVRLMIEVFRRVHGKQN